MVGNRLMVLLRSPVSPRTSRCLVSAMVLLANRHLRQVLLRLIRASMLKTMSQTRLD